MIFPVDGADLGAGVSEGDGGGGAVDESGAEVDGTLATVLVGVGL